MQVTTLVFSFVCVFIAALVRGYAGFGFSLLSITALAIVLEPRQIVPSIFILEVAASAHLLAGTWRDVHWPSLRWLALGCLLGTPLGVYALARAPAAPLTLALGIVVFIIALALARGFVLASMPGRWATAGTGFASGVLNGSIGVGGPPVVIFFFGSPAGVATGRASMIAYFLFTDLLGLAWQWHDGLIDRPVLERALLYAPALIVGVWLGNRAFRSVDSSQARRWVLRLLMVLAALSGGRAVLQMSF